jgi:hypothetical protein
MVGNSGGSFKISRASAKAAAKISLLLAPGLNSASRGAGGRACWRSASRAAKAGGSGGTSGNPVGGAWFQVGTGRGTIVGAGIGGGGAGAVLLLSAGSSEFTGLPGASVELVESMVRPSVFKSSPVEKSYE